MEILKIFIGIILVILFLWLVFLNFRKRLLDEISYNFIISKKNQIIKAIFFSFVLIFLLLAYFEVNFLNFDNFSNIKTSNITFVIDTSKSMNIMDINYGNNYSRLDYAKELVKNYVNKNSQNNYSLVAFAGDILIISPLTHDLDTYLTFLDNLNSNTISAGGTNFNKMLDTVENLGDKLSNNVIILSDGGSIEDGVDQNKYFSNNKNIKIFTLGIGSYKGDRIPIGQDIFGNISYKQYNGEYIIEGLNEANLKTIANITKGNYLNITQNLEVLQKINNKLLYLGNHEIKNDIENGQRIIIFISFILLSIGYLIPYRFKRGKN